MGSGGSLRGGDQVALGQDPAGDEPVTQIGRAGRGVERGGAALRVVKPWARSRSLEAQALSDVERLRGPGQARSTAALGRVGVGSRRALRSARRLSAIGRAPDGAGCPKGRRGSDVRARDPREGCGPPASENGLITSTSRSPRRRCPTVGRVLVRATWRRSWLAGVGEGVGGLVVRLRAVLRAADRRGDDDEIACP